MIAMCVIFFLQWCTLLSMLMLVWSYVIMDHQFGECLLTLEFEGTSPTFLHLVIVPAWFLMPSLANMNSVMYIYAIVPLTMSWKAAKKAFHQLNQQCLVKWLAIYPFGFIALVIGCHAVYIVVTLVFCFSTVFVPISVLIVIVLGILGLTVMFGDFLINKVTGTDPKLQDAAVGIFAKSNLITVKGYDLSILLPLGIFGPLICGPIVILGSILGWHAYQGGQGEDNVALIGTLYRHVFAVFSDWDFNVPAFAFDLSLITEIPLHIANALYGTDPLEFFSASTGLIALNLMVSSIKPTILVANYVLPKVIHKAGFETETVDGLFGAVQLGDAVEG